MRVITHARRAARSSCSGGWERRRSRLAVEQPGDDFGLAGDWVSGGRELAHESGARQPEKGCRVLLGNFAVGDPCPQFGFGHSASSG